MSEWLIHQISILESREPAQSEIMQIFSEKEAEKTRAFHKQIEDYEKTPLVSLPHLAAKWGVGGIYVKDESKRFSLNAFKGLGGSYAMFRIICDRLGLDPARTSLMELLEGENKEKTAQFEFVTCTDGNHGRGGVLGGRDLRL